MRAGLLTDSKDVLALTGLAGCEVVPDAAAVSGGSGDAVVEIDWNEHQRRLAAGFVGITDLPLLDRLLTLPYGEPILRRDLSPRDSSAFCAAPAAAVETSETCVRRVLKPVVRVSLVVVRDTTWRVGLRRAAAFEPFAQRVLLLPSRPQRLDHKIWEADCLGVGVWVMDGDQIQQLVAPAPWKQHYVKAAGWRFTERVYTIWRAATATLRPGSCGDVRGRPARQAAAEPDQLPF
ncbi:hypothetical protein ACFWY9_19640 [Amycolatopsis sp. NPDC059027]|uniref:hypothetical protein n=1 Tax=Amycolatopsis sp. NPDC059027 TaxID=3346709 RepID=UPI00366C1085